MAEQKSEKPTKKRLLKAREEGSAPSTRQFIAGLQFCVVVTLINARGGDWLTSAAAAFHGGLERAFSPSLTPADVLHLGGQLASVCLLPLTIAGAGLAVLGSGIHLGVTKMTFAPKKLIPDPKRLSPLNKLKQLPRQNLTAALQSLILLPLFIGVIWAAVSSQAELLFVLPLASVRSGLFEIAGQMKGLLWKAAGVFLIFGCIELLRETRRHSSELKMSKQEVKEESKETDGNPQIKARIRTIRRSLARRRMMQAVPTATAVIVNPTHYSVALKYDPATMPAPLIVAKGKNYLALRIRKKALEHNVPIIENPPVAQALYKSVDIGQEIPAHMYRAIAEILAYIYRIVRN